MHARRAFTLIEVLVVVAIIALLVAILMPSLARARAQTRTLTCTSNVRQLVVAAHMYAQQHPRGQYLPLAGDGGYDGLRFLYPTYVRNFNVTVCPTTKNVVKRVQDLDDNANSSEDDSGGHSYESRGWMYPNHIYNGKRIGSEGNSTSIKLIKSTKNIDRPAQVCLLSDADDQPGFNNWPDKENNHGLEGVNVGYCDGHASFVRTGRLLMSMFLSGYYNPGLDSSLYLKYGVTKSSTSVNSVNWTVFEW